MMFNNPTFNQIFTQYPTVSPATEQSRPTVYIYNVVTCCVELMENPTFDANNNAVAPLGYTACYLTTQQTEQPTINPVVNKSRSTSVEDMTSQSPKRKFSHRSKQNCIEKVFEDIKTHFEPLGIYADGETEVLRGEDTCRVHVKSYAGLKQILEVLKEVYDHEKVTLKRLATCISMKNKFQKKGFIAYMKLSDSSQVPFVQEIFSKYKDLYKKCDVAAPKDTITTTKKVSLEIQANNDVVVSKNDPFTIDEDSKTITLDGLVPAVMVKESSLGA